MKRFSIIKFNKTLKNLGLKTNDNVLLVPELFRLGKLENVNNAEEYYSTILNTILKIIGPKGTIFINTYTFDRSRLNKDFINETSVSSAGAFSNYILKKKVVRSNHPVFSVSGLGKNAKTVCSNNSSHNFGYLSPYYKMMNINTKILCLGIEMIRNPFSHVAEYFMGVPYCYNKIFKKRVIKNNKTINKKFVSFVRYLNLKFAFDINKLEKLLIKKKILKQKKINGGNISICHSVKYFDYICGILSKDIHGLLKKKPNYDLNRYPYV
tara:strand:+ start:118 stop:918 length:801 start_codon:yes stop_codon:yes gene_type:complete